MAHPYRRTGTSSAALVVVTFALLCTGLLAVVATTRSAHGQAVADTDTSDDVCSSEAAFKALEETARADLALREKNFGAAHIYVQRARVRLEAALASTSDSAEPDEVVESR